MKTTINRRTFLRLGSIASSSLFLNSYLQGMNHFFNPRLTKNGEVYEFAVGNFECVCINDGGHSYKPSDFFKDVSKEQIEDALNKKNLPIDSIYTPYTHLIVNTGEHRILVDVGAGKVIPNNGKLPQTMKSIGIEPSDIDIIFITHAHPDHIGGMLDDEGKPIYLNARYYIWKGEWDFWFSESASEKTWEFFIKTAREQLGPVKDRMVFLEKESEVFPGINVLSAPGHTPGHMVVSFSSAGEQLYYVGDTVLYPLHLEHPDWLPIYDILPEQAAVSKRRIFNLVSENKALVIGQHFTPFPSLGNVLKTELGWLWNPIEKKD